jgi:hypothetical protein
MRTALIPVVLFFAVMSCVANAEEAAAGPVMSLNSSQADLVRAYGLYVDRVKTWEAPKDVALYPCYNAGIPDRNSFCVRDFDHQALGGHFVGFDAHNRNITGRFAKSIFAQKDYQISWHIYYKKPAEKMYDNWFQVTPNFEMIATAYNDLYLWTGDRFYIDDPDMNKFYQITMTDFLAKHDLKASGNFVKGIIEKGGYNERDGVWDGKRVRGVVEEGGDIYGVQCQGYRAYAEILNLQKKPRQAEEYGHIADRLLETFRKTRWMDEYQVYASGLTAEGQLAYQYGREASFFILKCGLAEPGERARAHVARMLKDGNGDGGEAKTYRADCLYPYGYVNEGYEAILQYNGPEKLGYPEFGFTGVSHCARWLMGMSPDAARHVLVTRNNLPTNKGQIWVEVSQVGVGVHVVNMRHDKTPGQSERSRLTHVKGPAPLIWEVQFHGNWKLTINGEPLKASTRRDLAGELTHATVQVKPGETVEVVAQH